MKNAFTGQVGAGCWVLGAGALATSCWSLGARK